MKKLFLIISLVTCVLSSAVDVRAAAPATQEDFYNRVGEYYIGRAKNQNVSTLEKAIKGAAPTFAPGTPIAQILRKGDIWADNPLLELRRTKEAAEAAQRLHSIEIAKQEAKIAEANLAEAQAQQEVEKTKQQQMQMQQSEAQRQHQKALQEDQQAHERQLAQEKAEADKAALQQQEELTREQLKQQKNLAEEKRQHDEKHAEQLREDAKRALQEREKLERELARDKKEFDKTQLEKRKQHDQDLQDRLIAKEKERLENELDKQRREAELRKKELDEQQARQLEMQDQLKEEKLALEKQKLEYEKDPELAAVRAERQKEVLKSEEEQARAKWEAIRQSVAQVTSGKAVLGYAGGVGVAAALVLASRLGYIYLKQKIGKPTLVKETSMPTTLREYVFGKKETEKLTVKDIVLRPALFEDFQDFSKVVLNARKNKVGFPSAIFYGPPGTGKTFGAKIIAKYSGLPFVIIAGSSFKQYKEGKDIYELDRIIRWARDHGPAIIFIDEADSAFPDRDTATAEKADFVNFFLSNVEEKYNTDFIFIYATNYPERMDKAFKQRTTFKYYFPLPELAEREEMLKMYLNKIFTRAGFSLSNDVVKHIGWMAARTQGFAGREIKGMVQTMLTKMLLEGKKELTKPVADKVVDKTVEQFVAEQQMEKAGEGHGYFRPQVAAGG